MRSANTAKVDVMENGKHSGSISVYFDTRAFGFIHEVVEGVVLAYFFHLRDVQRGVPKTGELVTFLPTVGEKGLKAKEVIVGGAA
jgi:cold shock CspA family protein